MSDYCTVASEPAELLKGKSKLYTVLLAEMTVIREKNECKIEHGTKFNGKWKAVSEVCLESPDVHSIELE